jgi:predicted site-specific integrase-resolvase
MKRKTERLLNSSQTAERLGISRGTLANWAYRGDHPQLPFFKIGEDSRHARRMYRLSDVEAFRGRQYTDTGQLQ